MLSHYIFSPVVTPRGRFPDGSTQVCKKRSHMNWPHEVSFAQTLQIPVSVLYFICLFYCFVNWTPEAPIFRLVRFMPRFRHKIKYKIPKTRKTNMKKFQNWKQNTSFQFYSLRFCFFSSKQLSFFIIFSPLSWGQLKLKVEECKEIIYFY